MSFYNYIIVIIKTCLLAYYYNLYYTCDDTYTIDALPNILWIEYI